MTDETTSAERSLSTILAAVDLDIARGPKQPAPRDGIPVHAAEAHKNISVYGEAYATHLERSGDDVLGAAKEYRDYCFRVAALARDEYKAEADRASKFIESLQKRAKALGVAARDGGEGT